MCLRVCVTPELPLSYFISLSSFFSSSSPFAILFATPLMWFSKIPLCQPQAAAAMINRPPQQQQQPQRSANAGPARQAPPSTPQCICSSCFTPLPLPRPDPTGTPFQCPQCRMAGVDMKVLYTRRAFPTEHSTN